MEVDRFRSGYESRFWAQYLVSDFFSPNASVLRVPDAYRGSLFSRRSSACVLICHTRGRERESPRGRAAKDICRVRMTWFQTYLIHSTSRAGDNQEGWLPPSSDSEKRGKKLADVRKSWKRGVWSESEWVWCAARGSGFALSCLEYIYITPLSRNIASLVQSKVILSVTTLPSQRKAVVSLCARWHVYSPSAGVSVKPASETTPYFQDIDRGVMLSRNEMKTFIGFSSDDVHDFEAVCPSQRRSSKKRLIRE